MGDRAQRNPDSQGGRPLGTSGIPRTSKISLEKARLIIELYRSGKFSYEKLARIFGYGHTTIWNILNGRYPIFKDLLDSK